MNREIVSPSFCKICGGRRLSIVYHGQIRTGRIGSLSTEPQTVWLCEECGTGYLPGQTVDYESNEYRTLVDGSDAPEEFYRLHDGEQADRLRMLGTSGLRDKVLMDVGCGAGSFLDLVKGLCKTTIGIEPTQSLQEALVKKGHETFPYCHEVPASWNGKVDIAVLFSVIEHLPDPLALLRDIRRLMKPGGRLLLSTPNRRDWLLELLPDDYARFFYRTVHTWYFDTGALSKLVCLAGFVEPSISYHHRYDLSNAMLWLRDKRPTGLAALKMDSMGDAFFRSALEASGRADYLYCSCINPSR